MTGLGVRTERSCRSVILKNEKSKYLVKEWMFLVGYELYLLHSQHFILWNEGKVILDHRAIKNDVMNSKSFENAVTLCVWFFSSFPIVISIHIY